MKIIECNNSEEVIIDNRKIDGLLQIKSAINVTINWFTIRNMIHTFVLIVINGQKKVVETLIVSFVWVDLAGLWNRVKE